MKLDGKGSTCLVRAPSPEILIQPAWNGPGICMSHRFGNPGMENPASPKINTIRAGCISNTSLLITSTSLSQRGELGIAKLGEGPVLGVKKACGATLGHLEEGTKECR